MKRRGVIKSRLNGECNQGDTLLLMGLLKGIKAGATNVNHLGFADNMVLVSEDTTLENALEIMALTR